MILIAGLCSSCANHNRGWEGTAKVELLARAGRMVVPGTLGSIPWLCEELRQEALYLAGDRHRELFRV